MHALTFPSKTPFFHFLRDQSVFFFIKKKYRSPQFTGAVFSVFSDPLPRCMMSPFEMSLDTNLKVQVLNKSYMFKINLITEYADLNQNNDVCGSGAIKHNGLSFWLTSQDLFVIS